VPNDTPQKLPPALIVPTAVLLLAHVPPAGLLLNRVHWFTHTEPAPAIAAGKALTVMVCTLLQPVPRVYVILVVPAATTHTTPVVFTVPTATLLLAHVPPPLVEARVMQLPSHTCVGPVSAVGTGLTVIMVVAVQPDPSE
jgi:hypothetical protein